MSRIISERAARINERTGRTEETLLYLKYVDDELAKEPNLAGRSTGISLRVLARTMPDGRRSVAASIYERVHRTRASGKSFHYWQLTVTRSMSLTKQGLIVMRNFSKSTGVMNSSHVWAEDQGPEWLVQFCYHFFAYPMRSMVRERQPRALEGPELGDTSAPLEALIEAAADAAARHMGEFPTFEERFPLFPTTGYRSGAVYLAHLDAHDLSQVAKNLFGAKNYRRPLVGEIQRLDNRSIMWFLQFRGLVPIEWIIDAMRETEPRSRRMLTRGPSNLQYRQIRAILRRTPAPVLARILKESRMQAERTLIDAANAVGHVRGQLRNLDQLPGLIQARGQRRVRDARDLEHLVRSLPEIEQWTNARGRATEKVLAEEATALQELERFNQQVPHLPAELDVQEATWEQWKDDAFRQRCLGLLEVHRRAIMTDRQRAYAEQEEQRRLARIARNTERAAWATQTTQLLDGLEVAPEMVLKVASDGETLARWGASMNNCIGGYARELGLDVLAAVVEKKTGVIRLNLQIRADDGVVQFLGKNNRDAVRSLPVAVAQQIVDAITDTGVPFDKHAIGMSGLRARELQAA